MFCELIRRVMLRELEALGRQIEAYDDEGDIWEIVPGIENSAGTLAFHLAGNLQHFVGGVLGGSSYIRDREAEFGRRDLSRSELRAEVDAARTAVEKGLAAISDADLAKNYPAKLGDATLTSGQFLVHLAAHLAYHVGQIDYHRRILTGGGRVEGALSIGAIASGDA